MREQLAEWPAMVQFTLKRTLAKSWRHSVNICALACVQGTFPQHPRVYHVFPYFFHLPSCLLPVEFFIQNIIWNTTLHWICNSWCLTRMDMQFLVPHYLHYCEFKTTNTMLNTHIRRSLINIFTSSTWANVESFHGFGANSNLLKLVWTTTLSRNLQWGQKDYEKSM